MNAPQTAWHWGYATETYYVTTDDGYILQVLRLPRKRNDFEDKPQEHRPVVFLQHGLDGSAYDFVANLPNQAPAFVFADAGFDVWLGNFRGNYYARGHINPNITQGKHEFWQFSWTEMADHDLPAMINFALKTSKAESLYYVAHALGTTTAFAKLSEDPEFAKKIKRFYALSPMTNIKHVKGPFGWFAPMTLVFEKLFGWFGMDQFQPNEYFMYIMTKLFCGNVVTKGLCTNYLFLIGGPNSNQLNTTRLPVYLTHAPSGTSTRTMLNIGQMIVTGKFQAFDFRDKKKNQARYGQDTPREYDLSKITTPVALYFGGQDWLAPAQDVQTIVPKLKSIVGNTYLQDFNHFDFLWGLRAAPQVYFPIANDIRDDFDKTGEKLNVDYIHCGDPKPGEVGSKIEC
jgi:pimeloyl-ACP methyl ester carboxylesterase